MVYVEIFQKEPIPYSPGKYGWFMLEHLFADFSIVKLGWKVSIIIFASIVIVSQAVFTVAEFISESINKESNNQLPYILLFETESLVLEEKVLICYYLLLYEDGSKSRNIHSIWNQSCNSEIFNNYQPDCSYNIRYISWRKFTYLINITTSFITNEIW